MCERRVAVGIVVEISWDNVGCAPSEWREEVKLAI